MSASPEICRLQPSPHGSQPGGGGDVGAAEHTRRSPREPSSLPPREDPERSLRHGGTGEDSPSAQRAFCSASGVSVCGWKGRRSGLGGLGSSSAHEHRARGLLPSPAAAPVGVWRADYPFNGTYSFLSYLRHLRIGGENDKLIDKSNNRTFGQFS